MAIHSLLEVDIPEAAHLADLFAIQEDLSVAGALAEHVLRSESIEMQVGHVYLDARESLVRDAIVQYFRCFSGLRYNLDPKVITTFGEDALKIHQYLFALRNKFIAHPVNPFEEYGVTVSAVDAEDSRTLGKTVSFRMSHRIIREAEAEQLLFVISRVREWLSPLIESEKKKLEAFIATLPRSVTDKWKVGRAGIFPRADVDKRRRQRVHK